MGTTMIKDRHVTHRKYGKPPLEIIVVHGGPGAPGGMAPVAWELGKRFGVLEPFQGADSIHGQIEELKFLLHNHCAEKVILIGHSWGAWLAWMYAAKYPDTVKQLILIGAGPFEKNYASDIMQTRLHRLNHADRTKTMDLLDMLQRKGCPDRKKLFQRFGALMSRADTFAPISEENHVLEFQPDIFEAVWPEAKALRGSGTLLEIGQTISCPVVAFHGVYDPHPIEGVEKPLPKILNDFRMIKLEKCGHYPWNEKFAREKFYSLLIGEIS